MRGCATMVAVVAATWAVATVMMGCTSKDEASFVGAPATESSSATTIAKQELRPISLADLSRAAPSVQEQMRQAYSAFVVKIDEGGATAIERGNAYGEMGKLFLAGQFDDMAESCLLNAQMLAPNDMRWPYYLGHFYKAQGDNGKSIAFFERTLQLRPDDVATLVWLGEEYLTQDRSESAEPVFKKALSHQPGIAAALAGLGRARLARQDYVSAVKYLEKALALNNQASTVRYSLAMAYRRLGEISKAEAHLRQRGNAELVLPDPLMQEIGTMLRSATAYESLGIRSLEQGESAAAASYFRKGIELAPDSSSLRHRLGTALFLVGDGRAATQEFEAALRLSPGFAKAHYSLGVLMASAGRYQEAVERLSAAVKYDPAYIEAHLLLAYLLRQGHQFKESLLHYRYVLSIDPRIAEALMGSAMALVASKQYEAARDRLTEAVQLYPDQADFVHALVRLLAAAPDDRVRDGRRAVALMGGVLKQQPTAEMEETMAMALAELGNYEQARTWQRQAIATAQRVGLDPQVRLQMAENLRLFERNVPCRVPWRDGTMP